MPILHTSTTNMRSFEFILTHTMVAGLNTPAATTGLDTDLGIGSINPLGFPDTFGRAIFDFKNDAAGALVIAIDSAGGSVPSTFWDICKFTSTDGNWDGRTLRREDFGFTTNARAEWTLAGQPSFVNGITYFLDWT